MHQQLKQLGLAAMNYTDVNALPPTSGAAAITSLSMKPRMLNFMEQTALFNSFHMSQLYSSAFNYTNRVTIVATVLCPSDGNVPSGTTSTGGPSAQTAYHSYPNNMGTLAANNFNQFDGPAHELGSPSMGPAVTLAMIKDGTTNTVIFSECLRGNNEIITRGNWQWFATPDTGTVATPLTTLVANCIKAAATTPVPASGGQKCSSWLDHNTGEGGGYTHIMMPNTPACQHAGTSSKYHTGIGASCATWAVSTRAFLDGSVKFIKDSVNPATWRAISTTLVGEAAAEQLLTRGAAAAAAAAAAAGRMPSGVVDGSRDLLGAMDEHRVDVDFDAPADPGGHPRRTTRSPGPSSGTGGRPFARRRTTLVGRGGLPRRGLAGASARSAALKLHLLGTTLAFEPSRGRQGSAAAEPVCQWTSIPLSSWALAVSTSPLVIPPCRDPCPRRLGLYSSEAMVAAEVCENIYLEPSWCPGTWPGR